MAVVNPFSETLNVAIFGKLTGTSYPPGIPLFHTESAAFLIVTNRATTVQSP